MPAIDASTVANKSRLIYASQGNLRDTPWACSAWLYVRTDGGGGNPRYILNLAAAGPNYGITWRRQNASGGNLEIFKTNGAGFASYSGLIQTAAGSFPLNTWIHVIVENDYPTGTDATKFRAFINGTQVNAAGSPLANDLTDFNTELNVLGRYNATTLQSDGAIHKLLWIKNRIFTADERATLLAGRYPTTIATSDVYFRADYDLTLDGVDSDGNVEPVVTNENTVTLVTFPANLPGLAYYRKANSGVFSDTGSTASVHKGTCQQWNDATGIGNGNSSQSTLINKPGVILAATGPGPSRICYGDSNDRTSYNQSEMSPDGGVTFPGTAKWLDLSGGPVFDPRKSTVVIYGAQYANQTNGGSSFGYAQYVATLGTATADALAMLAIKSGKLTAYGNNYTNEKAGTLAIGATPTMFGAIFGASSVQGFVGTTLETMGTGALPALTPNSGVRTGASKEASPSHNSTFQGSTIEELVYQVEQDATNLAALSDYFSDTYGITPHDQRRVVIRAEGSSTTFGIYSTHNLNFWGALPATAYAYKVINFGTGSAVYTTGSFDGFDDRYAGTMGEAGYSQELSGRPLEIDCLFINFNELASVPNNQSGADIMIGYFDDLAARSRALGRVVVGATLFRNANTTARDLYNTYIRNNADVVFDLKQLVDAAVLTIASDGIHLTADSQEAAASYLATTLQSSVNLARNLRGGSFRVRNFRSRAFIR